MELMAPNGTILTLGSTDLSPNVSQVVRDFIAPVSGLYRIRITGDPATKYSVVVTRNAEFDNGANDSIATAQDLVTPESAGKRWALGAIEPGTNALFVTDGANPYTIQQVDSTTGAIVAYIPSPIPVGGGPDGLAFDGTHLYLVNSYYSDHLYTLDATTGALLADTPLNSPGYLDGVAFLAGKVYISNSDTDQILAFDPVSQTVTGYLTPGVDLGGGLAGITGPDALIASVGFYGVAEIDPVTGAIRNMFYPNAGSILGVATSQGSIYLGGYFGAINVYDRDGEFEQSVYYPYPITAIGGDDVGGEATGDFYRITAVGNTTIEIETSTPAAGAGEFRNDLDPLIRLYDSSGNLVASNDNGASDGRNAKLTYIVPAGGGGTYYVEVASSDLTSDPTVGEYVLSVKGTTAVLPPFVVTTSDPAQGDLLAAVPTTATIDLNDTILLSTLQGTDLKVDGVSATGVTPVDGNTASFDISKYAFAYNGKYYALTSAYGDWHAAEAKANSLGGHLVAVNNEAENNFLVQHFATGPNALKLLWIGLNDFETEGTFVWSNGDPVTYTNFYPGEPNDYLGIEDGVQMNLGVFYNGDPNGWNDYFNNGLLLGIMELPSLPSGYWLASDGTHTLSVNAGAFNDVQNTPVSAYSSTFTVDMTPPTVIASSVQDGEILDPGSQDLTFTFTFSEAMNTAQIDIFDVALVGQNTGLRYPYALNFNSDGTVLTVIYSGVPEDAYQLRLLSGPAHSRISSAGRLMVRRRTGPSRQTPPATASRGANSSSRSGSTLITAPCRFRSSRSTRWGA